MDKETWAALAAVVNLIQQARDVMDEDVGNKKKLEKLDDILDGHGYRESTVLVQQAYKESEEHA